jgi:hypothetical protein
VLARIEVELANHGGTDNGRLPVTYGDFVTYGIERHSVAPAIRELVELGFVEITEHGRGGNAEFRSPNKFRLTYRPAKGVPSDGSHEWRKIQTMKEARQRAKAARMAAGVQQRTKGRPKPVPRQQKQNPSAGKNPSPVRETPTEMNELPVRDLPTTTGVANPALLSISRGGSRSAPEDSAVASEPPRSDAGRKDAISAIMRTQGCNAIEAARIFDALPDAPPCPDE